MLYSQSPRQARAQMPTVRRRRSPSVRFPDSHGETSSHIHVYTQLRLTLGVVGKLLPPLQRYALEWVRDCVMVITALHHPIEMVE